MTHPPMTKVRSILPARLRRARFATIAKDDRFRRYFAPSDDSASIRKVLVRLYETHNDQNSRSILETEAKARSSQRASQPSSSSVTVHSRPRDEVKPPNRRQERLDRFRRERERALDSRRRERDDNRIRSEEDRFLLGEKDELTLFFHTPEELTVILRRFEPALRNGERFVVKFGKKYMTLSFEKYADLLRLLTQPDMDETHPWDKSDAEFVEFIGDIPWSTSITMSRPSARVGRKWSRPEGEFFPYIHRFECEELTKELANLGCWREVDSKNHKENCLYLAFVSAAVPPPTLDALKLQFLRRKIARKNLRSIAEEHNLHVTIRTEGKSKLQTYGPHDGFPVRLALIQDHYIHLYKTRFKSYAVAHYNELKHKPEWWSFKTRDKRDRTRGMLSIDLLKAG